MTNSIPLPMEYGLRLQKWRNHQYEAIRGIADSPKKYVVIEGKTGTGKTAVGIALAKEFGCIRVVTKTRSLQDQYASNTYRGKPLYGLAAYPCALIPGFTATECVFPGNMPDCPRAGSCGYLRAKQAMLESNKQVISYAYWFTAGWLTKDEFFSDIYFDEAHEIPAFTMNFLEKRIDRKWGRYVKRRLPKLPDTENQMLLRTVVKRWMAATAVEMAEEAKYIKEHEFENKDEIKRGIMLQNESDMLLVICDQLEHRPDEMMIIVHGDLDFTVAPLTARMFRSFLSQHKFEKAVFTSATIGNPSTFMGGIGFERDIYDYIDVPSNFTPKSMPVYIPPGTPRIGYKSSDADLQQQAVLIADIINQCPSDWSGMIHTASTAQSFALANRLSAMDSDLAKRIWVPDQGSSSSKIEAWQTQKMMRPDTIAISWDFWTGLDAPDDRINIVAKVPFGTLDVLGKARMEMDKKFYAWEAACKVEQAAGRNRRGEPDHYEEQGQPTRRVTAILDRNVYRVYNQFSSHFKERINCVKDKPVQVYR